MQKVTETLLEEKIRFKASELKSNFELILSQSHNYEAKGVWNSEMLFVCSLVSEIKPEHIIESGRARGQSTEVLARFLRGEIRFDSVELDSDTSDSRVAEARIKKLEPNMVNLHYGDSFVEIPKLIKQKGRRFLCIIDGPKGVAAIELMHCLLAHEKCLGVFMHDFSKNNPLRMYFHIRKFIQFTSEEEGFLEENKHLDSRCYTKNRKPYWKEKKGHLKSYGPTMIFIPKRENSEIKLSKPWRIILSLISKLV